MTVEERLVRLEQAFVTLTDLARGASERADTHEEWINQLGAAQANSEAKIAALADAQIRTEEAFARLSAAQIRTEATLAAAQAETDKRLGELIEIVRGSRGGG